VIDFKKISGRLKSALVASTNEKDVENAYRAILSEILPEAGSWSSPFGVDGLLPVPACETVPHGGDLLAEFKWDVQLSSSTDRAKVLAQALFYLRRLEGDKQARKLPAALLVGDVNEFFLISTQPLLKYLSEPDISEGGAWDWSVAPSSAWQQGALVLRLAQDSDLAPSWVWEPQSSGFGAENVEDVRNKILANLNSSEYLVSINPESMISVFERWRDCVLHKSELGTLNAQEQVGIFMRSLLDREAVYQHPKSHAKLVVEGRPEPVRIQPGTHEAFWKHFRSKYSLTEKREFTGNKDRLVEEENRRRTGEFMTPAIWVAEAHQHLDGVLGEGWRDRYVVWDCSCGTANLTRDFNFKHLYLSTLNQEDVDTIKTMRYNGAGMTDGATVFKFDFLNDPLDKLPQGLRDALNDSSKPLLFLNNPPYGTAGNKKVVSGTETKGKAGMAQSDISAQMKREGVGASGQLYTQFMFRMEKIAEGRPNVVLGLFSKSDHMRSSSYANFTNWWLQRYKSESGFLFCANEFADVSGAWAVCWNVWTRGSDERREWSFDVKKRVREGAAERVDAVGTKTLYLSDWKPSNETTDKSADKERKFDLANWRLTGALTPKSNIGTTYNQFKVSSDDIAYFEGGHFDSPISENLGVYSTSGPSKHSRHVSPGRLRQFAPVMILRDLPKVEWHNQKDEFLAPDETHPEWSRWVADALLFLPLCGKGEFSGLRDLAFPDLNGKPQTYQVKNHWALLSRERVMELADAAGFDLLYADAELHRDPVRQVTPVYDEVLAQEPVSAIGRRCFEEARRLTELTISSGSRRLLCDDKPEFHLQAWDAGWKQTRKVLEAYHPQEWKAWKAIFDEWRSELRELVYELGYLRR